MEPANLMVGANCEDIRLEEEIQMEGTTSEYPYYTNRLPSYYSGKIQKVEDAEYEELLGMSIPDEKWSGELGINDAVCQMYYAKSALARLIYKILWLIKRKE